MEQRVMAFIQVFLAGSGKSWYGAEGTATDTRERAIGAVAEVQPWTGSCRPEYLPT